MESWAIVAPVRRAAAHPARPARLDDTTAARHDPRGPVAGLERSQRAGTLPVGVRRQAAARRPPGRGSPGGRGEPARVPRTLRAQQPPYPSSDRWNPLAPIRLRRGAAHRSGARAPGAGRAGCPGRANIPSMRMLRVRPRIRVVSNRRHDRVGLAPRPASVGVRPSPRAPHGDAPGADSGTSSLPDAGRRGPGFRVIPSFLLPGGRAESPQRGGVECAYRTQCNHRTRSHGPVEPVVSTQVPRNALTVPTGRRGPDAFGPAPDARPNRLHHNTLCVPPVPRGVSVRRHRVAEDVTRVHSRGRTDRTGPRAPVPPKRHERHPADVSEHRPRRRGAPPRTAPKKCRPLTVRVTPGV